LLLFDVDGVECVVVLDFATTVDVALTAGIGFSGAVFVGVVGVVVVAAAAAAAAAAATPGVDLDNELLYMRIHTDQQNVAYFDDDDDDLFDAVADDDRCAPGNIYAANERNTTAFNELSSSSTCKNKLLLNSHSCRSSTTRTTKPTMQMSRESTTSLMLTVAWERHARIRTTIPVTAIRQATETNVSFRQNTTRGFVRT
jgi:hypothetical protein